MPRETYAGDPEASDYAGAILPATLRNTEIANQANLDVVINSSDPNYTDDTDYTDGGGSSALGNPCALHTTGDDISAPGHWTDVRVKERPAVPRRHHRAPARPQRRPGPGRGAPGDQRHAVPAAGGAEQRDHQGSGAVLQPLHDPPRRCSRRAISPHSPSPTRAASQAGRRHALGLAERIATPPSAIPTSPSASRCPRTAAADRRTSPSVSRCASRAATRSTSTRTSCSQLLAMQYADCFSRLSQIRVWNDGNADNQVRIGDVRLTNVCGSAEGYFATLRSPRRAVASARRLGQLGRPRQRKQRNLAVPANFSVTVTGRLRPSQGSLDGSNGRLQPLARCRPTCSRRAPARTTSRGRHLGGHQQVAQLPGRTNCSDRQPEHLQVQRHRARHTGRSWARPAPPVRSRSSGPRPPVEQHDEPPGHPYATKDTGGITITVYPTVGIRTVLRTGVYTTLRLDDPQSNQTLQCDPQYAQGQEFSSFRYGCTPWYGANHLHGKRLRTRTRPARGGTPRRRHARRTASGSRTATSARGSASTRATTRGAAS